jgi:hypothetical protein
MPRSRLPSFDPQAAARRGAPAPGPTPAAPGAGAGVRRASTAGAPSAPPGFTDQLDPRPRPAASYGATFAGYGRWNEVAIDDATSSAGPQLPAQAEAGKPFRVSYVRELGDIGQPGTLEKVTLRYQVDGGPIQSKSIADGQRDLSTGQLVRMPAKIDVPPTAKGELTYWFELQTKDGRTVYDSDFGQNYRAEIVPAGGPTVKFDDLWGDAVSGPIHAGGTLRIAYDVDRLKQFMYGWYYRGFPSFSVNAFVSFDGKPAAELPLVTISRGAMGAASGFVPLEAAIEVPSDAKSVSIWFRGSSYGGSVYGGNVYDSKFGANYTYPVVSG